MQDFLAWRRGEKEIPEKSCVISIDDGYRSGYEVAWPVLKKHGYPFTMFIYTNYVKGQPNAGGQSLSWEELAEMRDTGVDIQSHTISHSNLRMKKGKYQQTFTTYEDWLRHELVDSKKMLEQQLGISVNCLAYPYGNHSDEIRKIVAEAGYEAAFTVYGQRITYTSHADQLGRYAIESTNPKVFADAMKMIGGGGGGGGESAIGQFAAASMVTQPMDGETISDPHPTLKANIATLGDVDPNSVELRLSGIGQVPVKYDPATKTVEANVTQKLRDKNYTVILSAKVKGRKAEIRWSFNFAPNAGAAAPVESGPPPRSALNPSATRR
jgi:peptidoglycan/xylan/chitin deacetylase (PgdA/CDA1 family)